ncbi:hypothetical protein IFM47457_10844 [Aspergillus lentulus]|nr:hypothetical protein IFM47457_10844 [Aspergillus lentulus]
MAPQQTPWTSPVTEYRLRKDTRYTTGFDEQGRSIVLAFPALRYRDRGIRDHPIIPARVNTDGY